MTPQRIMIVGHCGVQHITHATRIDEYSESWHTFFSGSPNSMLSGCVALSICYAPIILHSPMLWSCIRLGSDMPCAKLGTDRGVINGSVCGGQNAVSGSKRGMGGSRTVAFASSWTVRIFLANASVSTTAPQHHSTRVNTRHVHSTRAYDETNLPATPSNRPMTARSSCSCTPVVSTPMYSIARLNSLLDNIPSLSPSDCRIALRG